MLGTLVVAAGREAIGVVVRTIAAWFSRGDSRSVKVQLGDDSIELTDVDLDLALTAAPRCGRGAETSA